MLIGRRRRAAMRGLLICCRKWAVSANAMEMIEQANAEALQRLLAGDPVLIDVRPAGEVLADLAIEGKTDWPIGFLGLSRFSQS